MCEIHNCIIFITVSIISMQHIIIHVLFADCTYFAGLITCCSLVGYKNYQPDADCYSGMYGDGNSQHLDQSFWVRLLYAATYC